MEPTQVSFLVLMYTSAVVILVVGIFLVRLLIDLSKLSNTAKNAGEVIQNELEPTLKELQQTAKSINSIVHSADSQIEGVKKAFVGAADATRNVGHKMGGIFAGLAKGLALGIKLFKK